MSKPIFSGFLTNKTIRRIIQGMSTILTLSRTGDDQPPDNLNREDGDMPGHQMIDLSHAPVVLGPKTAMVSIEFAYTDAPFAFVFYELNGARQPNALRLDMDKRALLDLPPDVESEDIEANRRLGEKISLIISPRLSNLPR